MLYLLLAAEEVLSVLGEVLAQHPPNFSTMMLLTMMKVLGKQVVITRSVGEAAAQAPNQLNNIIKDLSSLRL
jgi:hypothetical protein